MDAFLRKVQIARQRALGGWGCITWTFAIIFLPIGMFFMFMLTLKELFLIYANGE